MPSIAPNVYGAFGAILPQGNPYKSLTPEGRAPRVLFGERIGEGVGLAELVLR